ncbi:MAG: GAF domain-containing protein [Spirochaetae bacterium HGW-Spirochaetae-8]|nr:MAG: GAF domain-containing protein [Spirochaetae bacterium HGW-Spirochaetae-8]
MFEKMELTGIRQQDEALLLEQLGALLEPSEGRILIRISSLANASALLGMYLERVNWVGFYLRDTDAITGEDLLQLGPFHGAPACVRIAVGKGVCGTACATGKTQLVPDVHAFPGHIACDSASRSELVVPLIVAGQVVGVLDIDSPDAARFSSQDARLMEQVAQLISLSW